MEEKRYSINLTWEELSILSQLLNERAASTGKQHSTCFSSSFYSVHKTVNAAENFALCDYIRSRKRERLAEMGGQKENC